MSPARVNDKSFAMAQESRKRPAKNEDDQSSAKRQRTQDLGLVLSTGKIGDSPYSSSTLTTAEELARKGLRRSIALTLQKVGFEGAAPEVIESFVSMTETCKAPADHATCLWALS